jgi:hypothetical protein
MVKWIDYRIPLLNTFSVGIMTGGQGGDGGTGTDSGIGGLGGQGRGPQIAENLKAQSIVINHNHTECDRSCSIGLNQVLMWS